MNKSADLFSPPLCDKFFHKNIYNGEEHIDNYHWLRDSSWPKVSNEKILNYLKSENNYTNQVMEDLRSQENEIYKEIIGRIKLADSSVPYKDKQYYYYNRTNEESNYGIFCRKKNSLENDEEIILDVDQLAKSHNYFDLGTASISPDQQMLAHSYDVKGDERYNLSIKNLITRKLLEDKLENIYSDITWHENNKGFFYNKLDNEWRPNKIYYHKLGEQQSQDKLIFEENDPLFKVENCKSSDKKYIIINTSSHNGNEIWYIDMEDSLMIPKLIRKRKAELFYDVDHGNGKFFILTNDKGKNFRIATAPNQSPTEENWEDLIPHLDNRYLKNFELYVNFLCYESKELGLTQLRILNLNDKEEFNIDFNDPIYEARIISTTYDASSMRFSYSSLNNPTSIREYNFDTKIITTLKTQEIPSGYEAQNYESKRIFANSNDGKHIPISIVYNKNLFKNDGSNPLYLYGYGAYGVGMPMHFRSNIITLLNRGFVFAIAHIRGGDDLNFEWYEDGKLLNKKNSFEDFIISSKFLCENLYTRPGNIVIAGGSAGGMLIGVVLNIMPELFKAAVLHVPFVDMLNTMFDETLPLTPGEFVEWGNPKEENFYNYIKSYSPYENIKSQSYPSIYITAGLSDPRVTYWEAAKWVAKLRTMKTDQNLLLLEVNMEAGHSGASGRFDSYKEVAKEYNFIFKIFNNY